MKDKMEFDEFYIVEEHVLENQKEEFITAKEMLNLLEMASVRDKYQSKLRPAFGQ